MWGRRTVRQAEEAYDGIDKAKPDQDLLELAIRTIERKKGKFDPSTFEDRYEKAVLDLIKSRKKSGKKVAVRETEEKPSNVINLFDALKKSLAAGERKGADKEESKEEPRKAQAKKPAQRKKAPPRKKAPAGKQKS